MSDGGLVDGTSVLHALGSFAVVAGLLTVVPGLDTALVMRATLVDGRRAGLATAVGVGSGCLVWGLAAAGGVAAVLAASQIAGTLLRLLGALYLGWIGLRLLRAGLRARPAADDVPPGGRPGAPGEFEAGGADAGTPARTSASAWWWRGFVTNLLNPKIGAFYVAVIPQFLPPGVPPALMGVLLAVVHDLEGLVWFAGVVLLVGRFRRLLARPAVTRAVDAGTGTVLVGFGVALAVEARRAA